MAQRIQFIPSRAGYAEEPCGLMQFAIGPWRLLSVTYATDTGAVGFGVSASEWRSFFSDATGSIDFLGQYISEIDLNQDASAITVAYTISGSSR